MPADVKYLGQLETKRLNLVAGALRSGPGAAARAQMETGGGVPFLIGTWSRPEARPLP